MRSPSESITFHHRKSFQLRHAGDCILLGVGTDFTMYVEEIYGESGFLSQTALSFSGDIIASIDEQLDHRPEPLPLPHDLIKPRSGWQTMRLNFAGARHRGLIETDRISELIRPLDIPTKLALAQRLDGDIAPQQILGITDSYVLSEARLSPTVYFICRRMRVAYALPNEAVDPDGIRYDYDTNEIYAAHCVDLEAEVAPPLETVLSNLHGVDLLRPVDCVLIRDYLVIAEKGRQKSEGKDEQKSQVHIWQIEGLPPTDDEALWHQKLYG